MRYATKRLVRQKKNSLLGDLVFLIWKNFPLQPFFLSFCFLRILQSSSPNLSRNARGVQVKGVLMFISSYCYKREEAQLYGVSYTQVFCRIALGASFSSLTSSTVITLSMQLVIPCTYETGTGRGRQDPSFNHGWDVLYHYLEDARKRVVK